MEIKDHFGKTLAIGDTVVWYGRENVNWGRKIKLGEIRKITLTKEAVKLSVVPQGGYCFISLKPTSVLKYE